MKKITYNQFDDLVYSKIRVHLYQKFDKQYYLYLVNILVVLIVIRLEVDLIFILGIILIALFVGIFLPVLTMNYCFSLRVGSVVYLRAS